MEKKEYIEPEIKIVDLSAQELILCGSGEDDDGMVNLAQSKIQQT